MSFKEKDDHQSNSSFPGYDENFYNRNFSKESNFSPIEKYLLSLICEKQLGGIKISASRNRKIESEEMRLYFESDSHWIVLSLIAYLIGNDINLRVGIMFEPLTEQKIDQSFFYPEKGEKEEPQFLDKAIFGGLQIYRENEGVYSVVVFGFTAYKPEGIIPMQISGYMDEVDGLFLSWR